MPAPIAATTGRGLLPRTPLGDVDGETLQSPLVCRGAGQADAVELQEHAGGDHAGALVPVNDRVILDQAHHVDRRKPKQVGAARNSMRSLTCRPAAATCRSRPGSSPPGPGRRRAPAWRSKNAPGAPAGSAPLTYFPFKP